MTYTLAGFPKEDKQPMKAAFDMMAKAAHRACQALLTGDLSASLHENLLHGGTRYRWWPQQPVSQPG